MRSCLDTIHGIPVTRPHPCKVHMKLRLFLAALPFVGMYSGGTLAEHLPMLFGMPFLLSWKLIWRGGTAGVLALLL